MWFRKKKLNSEEYEKLLHKFVELSSEFELIAQKIRVIYDKRFKINKTKPETENIKSPDGLDMLRGYPENV